MRFEQFEIEVDEEGACVFITQDNLEGEHTDCVKLGLHQVPMFIAALQRAVVPVEKAD